MSYYVSSQEVRTGVIEQPVDATDRFEIAQALSFVDGERAIGDFEAEEFELVFIDGPPKDRIGYVYEVDGSFEPSDTPHRFVSKGPVRIVKVFMQRPSDTAVWRVATDEERSIIEAAENPDTI